MKGYGKEAQIPPFNSQMYAVNQQFPDVQYSDCRILYEGGSVVSDKLFKGWFCVQIFRKGKFLFEDGVFKGRRP